MKTLLTILFVLAVAAVALAEKPVQGNDEAASRILCPFENVAYVWDFAVKDWGFTTGPCDEDGVPVWEYGESATWPTPLWGTALTTPDELCPDNAGESLISPSFFVDDYACLVEVYHGYGIYTDYDGGNVSVDGVVIEPMDGYPADEIAASPDIYAWCVDGEPGFSGGTVYELFSCFDLSDFMGQEIQLSFDYGSDASGQSPGWYISLIRVGGGVIANDGVTWSAVKAVYR